MARITIAWIKDQIKNEHYHQFPGTTVTVCVLTLSNGFNTVGSSACADENIFNSEVGRQLAYKDAEQKVWQLEGYLLKEKLAIGADVDHYPE